MGADEEENVEQGENKLTAWIPFLWRSMSYLRQVTYRIHSNYSTILGQGVWHTNVHNNYVERILLHFGGAATWLYSCHNIHTAGLLQCC
jgi:hypothetical protein